MEQYLTHDVVLNILNFLNKDNSFNFVNIAKCMMPLRKVLYGKYFFTYNKIPNEIKKDIRRIKCNCSDVVDNMVLDHLDLSCNAHTIGYQYIKTSPCKTIINSQPQKSIEIWCDSFNHTLDNLPHSLKSLTLFHCRNYRQVLNKLPPHLTTLNIIDMHEMKISNLPPQCIISFKA